jgi:hypothetical protein
MFWCLVGLLEIGKLELVKSLLEKYKAEDSRHLFGIHLGCYFIANLRITSPTQKDLARRISAKLAHKIRPLIFRLLNELKSLLLEYREGKIVALPDGAPKDIVETRDDGEVADLS